MIFIGIDPGAKGACAAIDDNGALLDIHRFGTHKDIHDRTIIDAGEFADWLRDYDDVYASTYIAIESVHAIHMASASNTFAFGRNLGSIEGVIGSMLHIGNNLTWVTPQAWKAHHSLIGADKSASKALATKQYGDKLIKSCDDAEATLIARWLFDNKVMDHTALCLDPFN